MNTFSLLTLILAQASALLRFDIPSVAPEHTDTEMQVLCLFRTSPKNRFTGAVTEPDKALNDLLGEIRREDRFGGILGEALVLTPPTGELKAKRLMVVGFGNSLSFTPERMRLVGRTVVRECDRTGVAHAFFAPTVKDGGVDRFATGQGAEQFVLRAMDANPKALWLKENGATDGPKLSAITFLAGTKYAPITQAGINKALGKGR